MLKKEIIRKIKLEKPKYFEANRFFGQKMSDFKKVNGMDFIYAESTFCGKLEGYSYVGFCNGEFLSGGISLYDMRNSGKSLFELIKVETEKELKLIGKEQGKWNGLNMQNQNV